MTDHHQLSQIQTVNRRETVQPVDRRRRVKRLVVPFGIYVTAVFAQLALSYAMPYAPVIRPTWIDFSGDVAWLCVRLLAVNAGALVFFELAIPRLRLQIPNIVHELVLGAAYVITCLLYTSPSPRD